MVIDAQYILIWLVLLSGMWIGAFPLLWLFTKKLPDGGFGVGLPFSIIVCSWLAWMLSSLGLMPFSFYSSLFSLAIIFSASAWIVLKWRKEIRLWAKTHRRILFFEFALYGLSLISWSFVRSYQPDIQGLEKFMDAGFVNSILRSSWMPPHDPWFTPLSINYYYFGHFTAAFLTLLSGIDTAITYNLMLATVFALSMVGGASVVFNFLGGRKAGIIASVLAAILLNFGGNLHTVWHFATQQEKPYWYPDATRFIPYTIHEFPAYSHVVADLHGHMMDLPVVLLFFVLLIAFLQGLSLKHSKDSPYGRLIFPAIFGFLFGIMSMTNTWDVPIYGLIFTIILVISKWKYRSKGWIAFLKATAIPLLVVAAAFILVSFPFHLHFKNFAKGIAFVDARSPIWQLGVLWGGFFIIAIVAALTVSPHQLPLTMIGVSFLLILIPEVIYVKDIYIREYHRANTMFKLTYESFVMMCLVFGMAFGKAMQGIKDKGQGTRDRKKKIWDIVAISVLLAVFAAHMAYPFFSIKSYYGLTKYRGLYGLQWFANNYPDDYRLLRWMQQNIQGAPVILEAVGESYTDYSRFSSFSGLPTVLGWRVHEWLWRGSFDEPGKRTSEVMTMYQTPLSAKAQGLFEKYKIQYIVVGALERTTYQVSEQELAALGSIVFRSGNSYVLRLE